MAAWGDDNDYYCCDFLRLYEHLETDDELLRALIDMKIWLIEKG